MTRIGRYQIKFPTTLLAMLPTGETISPRSKFPDQTASINISMPTSIGCLIGVNTRIASHPQGFF
ncbi:MAG: hypothetical protein DME78_11375 [Verrucomicrobia bacterium]|nr:MAG: hypothetical protein DME78_11375 [Verrucomicrobiota bacterium]